MEEIKNIITAFQKKLVALGFDEQQIGTILYEVVLIASAKLSQADLSFLTPEELEFVSNKDLLQLSPQQLYDITASKPNLVKYLDIYTTELKNAISEFDKIVEDVREEEAAGTLGTVPTPETPEEPH